MKRLILVVATLTSATSVAHAATSHPISNRILLRLLATQRVQDAKLLRGHVPAVATLHYLRQLSDHVPTRSRSTLGISRAPTNVSASSLALPDSVLSAGKGTQGFVSSGQGPFHNYHHSWNGFQSGVAAEFNFQPILTLFYQGSIFSDAGSAAAFMSDSFNLTRSWSSINPTDCSSTFSIPCEITGFVTTGGDLVLYTVAQVNYCVIEAGYQGDPTLINQNSDDASKALAGVTVTGIAEAKSACVGNSPAATTPQAPPQSTGPTSGDEFNNSVFAAPFTVKCAQFAPNCPDAQGPTTWSLNSVSPGFLRIVTQPGSLLGLASTGSNNARNLVLQPYNGTFPDWTVTTKLTFPATNTAVNALGQTAGIIAYQDDDNFIYVGRSFVTANGVGQSQIQFLQESAGVDSVGSIREQGVISPTIYLRLVKTGTSYTAYYSTDNFVTSNVQVPAGGSSSPAYVSNFPSPQIGLFAWGGTNSPAASSQLPADFDWFRLTTSVQPQVTGSTPGSGPAQLPTTSPPPQQAARPSISIDTIELLHQVRSQWQPTHSLNVGEKGRFLVTYHTTAAGQLTPSARLRISRGGRLLRRGHMNVALMPGGAPAFATVVRFGSHAVSRQLVASVTATLGPVSFTRSLRFTVKVGK